MDETRVKRFAAALTDLCKEHGMMIWTATVTTPVMASTVADGDLFHYVAERPEFGDSETVIIRRVLGEEAA